MTGVGPVPEMEAVPHQVLADLQRDVAQLRGLVVDLAVSVSGILTSLSGEGGEVDLQRSLEASHGDFVARIRARRGGA